MLRRAIVILMSLLVLNAVAAGWTAVYLLHQASEARAQQADRAEARTEQVRRDVSDLLAEMRDPATDTRRSELWRRAERIEQRVDEILEALD